MPSRAVKLLLFAALLSILAATPAPSLASPSPEPEPEPERDREVFVIPPDREAKARELLAPVVAQTPAELRWQGPRIEIERIKWWLMRGEQARAVLISSPAALAESSPDTAALPRSESFSIEVRWAPEVEASSAERELMEAAIAAIRERDAGGFYTVAVDSLYAEVLTDDEAQAEGVRSQDASPSLYNLEGPADPAAVHRRWGLELGAAALLVLFALAVTLRPESRQ